MNKKVLILGIILLFIVLCFIFGGNTNNNTNMNNNTNIENNMTEATTQSDELIEYYKDDAMINLFANKYNQLYDEKLTSEMLIPYYHHGSEHKNQVKLNMNNMEVILTGSTTKISVNIENDTESDEALRNLIKKFVKVYNQNITDNQIEEYLNNQSSSNDIKTYDGIEYSINKGLNNNVIESIKITGTLK